MNLTPEIVEGILAAAVGMLSWAGARLGGRKVEEQIKPTNGSTETLRCEVHTISIGMLSLHDKVDNLGVRLDTHIAKTIK